MRERKRAFLRSHPSLRKNNHLSVLSKAGEQKKASFRCKKTTELDLTISSTFLPRQKTAIYIFRFRILLVNALLSLPFPKREMLSLLFPFPFEQYIHSIFMQMLGNPAPLLYIFAYLLFPTPSLPPSLRHPMTAFLGHILPPAPQLCTSKQRNHQSAAVNLNLRENSIPVW